ncbi:MAG TPA: GNAT family N-acetyltransferase [Gaiellales bacterium]|nr:GNAT family N-acetyltransferase [Gaiellales bacterium]
MAAAGENVRAAHAPEAARIAQVMRAAFGEYRGVLEPPSGALSLDARAVRDLMELGGILACESEGRIVACVFHRTHPDHVYLGRLGVLPAFRGRGPGARLVAEVEALAGATGRERVRLGVRLALPRNRAFFERLGYRQVGLDSHEGMTVPTFAWLEKRIGSQA